MGEGGDCLGYMTWARVADDTERRLIHDPDVVLHPSEWNEGEKLWILDFVARAGYGPQLIREARRMLGDSVAHSVRRDAEGVVRKKVRWVKRVPSV